MFTKILVVFAICVKIVFSDDCTQKIEITYQTSTCCMNNETYTAFLEDPCYKNAVEKQINTIECMMECLYTEHGLMVNDSVVYENVNQYLQMIENETDRNRFIDAVAVCDKLGKKYILEKFGHLQTTSECRGYYLIFDACVLLNALTRCPEQYLSNSDYCRSKIKFLNECIFNKA